ncbi:MAG: GntR family transcriptional regulator [Pseudomonadota bacterium]
MLSELVLPPAALRSTSDFVAEALREAIVSGQLPAATELKQDDIAARFRVSKIPVREALKRLEAEGLVTFLRNKGAIVADLSPEEIWEYVEIRALLEARAAELAAPHISDAHLEQARAAMATFGEELNPARWGELNWKLHSLLYADAGRPVLLAEIRSLYDKVERYVRTLLAVTAEMPKTQREHEEIIAAFAARDAARAAELTRAHVLDGGAALLKYLSDHRVDSPAPSSTT